MVTFTDFVQHQALRDRLPFGIDFEITSTSSSITENIAGFEFPVFYELLSREAWFFEVIETLNGSKTSELQLSIRALAKKLKDACGIETISDAITQLFNPPKELVATPEYEQFTDTYLKEVDRVIELFRLSQDKRTVNWMLVTFFILSRLDSQWSFGKTAALRDSQIEEIVAFITKEANGGVTPEPEENAKTELEDIEKKTGSEKTGNKSTGK